MLPDRWGSDMDYEDAMGRGDEPERELGIELFVDWPGDVDHQRFTSWPDALRAISRYTRVLSCRVRIGIDAEHDDTYVHIEYRPSRQEIAVHGGCAERDAVASQDRGRRR